MDELVKILQLIRSPGIGPVTFHAFIKRLGSAKEGIAYLLSQKKEIFPQNLAEQEVKDTARCGAHLILHTDEDYPRTMGELHDAPPILTVLGKRDLLNKATIAIVGSRAASIHGTRFTQRLASDLGNAGYVIASGLARGIDGAAHKGSLETGTIAVVAGGVDIMYPPEHKQLGKDILKNGAVISEMPLGLFPGAKHFPRRNRLIASLSQGVCIVEAARPSGSLITASCALDQGREVFAVPGFPGDNRSVGTNHLIKQGAHVLESAEDVLNVLGSATLVHARMSHLSQKKHQAEKSVHAQDFLPEQQNMLNGMYSVSENGVADENTVNKKYREDIFSKNNPSSTNHFQTAENRGYAPHIAASHGSEYIGMCEDITRKTMENKENAENGYGVQSTGNSKDSTPHHHTHDILQRRSQLQLDILECLCMTPINIELILQSIPHAPQYIYDALTHLELSDRIIRDKNGYVSLAPS